MKGTCISHCVTINDDWYCRWMKWLWSILWSWFFNINSDFLTSCYMIMRYQSTKWFVSRTLKTTYPRLQSVHTLINRVTGDSHLESKVHEAYMGPNWGRQDLGGPHVGPMNLAIRAYISCHHCHLCKANDNQFHLPWKNTLLATNQTRPESQDTIFSHESMKTNTDNYFVNQKKHKFCYSKYLWTLSHIQFCCSLCEENPMKIIHRLFHIY